MLLIFLCSYGILYIVDLELFLIFIYLEKKNEG